MLVFYLEEPYGQLMKECMEGAQGRTHVRGNLFSLGMAWEDVCRCCQAVEHISWRERGKQAASTGSSQETGSTNVLLPRTEETLASLVRVCIRGGNKDLAQNLDGVTMRPFVVLQLIRLLYSSGYPGYEDKGVNAERDVNKT